MRVFCADVNGTEEMTPLGGGEEDFEVEGDSFFVPLHKSI